MGRRFAQHILLIIQLFSPKAEAKDRHATILAAYRMPDAYTLHGTTPATGWLSLGVMSEVKPGNHDVVDDYGNFYQTAGYGD